MKASRHGEILKIIAQNEVETQADLMKALADRGVRSTQATLSRDIKELRLVKELAPSGNYRYAVSARSEFSGRDERLRKIFKESVVSCDTAQNLVIIKTLPGLAMAASSAVDGMELTELVGTVAGDDTAFLAMRDVQSAQELCEEIRALFE